MPAVTSLSPAFKPAQERTAAVEFVAEVFIPIKDAVIGHSAQHGMADIGAAAVLDVDADRIAAARIADQRHARCAGAAFKSLMASASSRRWSSVEERLACSTLSSVRASGSVKLIANIRSRGTPFEFHPPQRGDPQRRVVAIAMHEQDRRDVGAPGSGRGLGERRKAEIARQQRQGAGALQQRPARQGHFVISPLFSIF